MNRKDFRVGKAEGRRKIGKRQAMQVTTRVRVIGSQRRV